MSSQPPPPRSLGAVPVAAHGHSISQGRRTELPPESADAVVALDQVLAAHGGRPDPGAASEIDLVCASHPDFLDAWARRGQAAYLAGERVAAYAYARVGYHRGLDRLRRHGWGGTGEVRWSDRGNRGFLRSLQLLMLSAAAIGERDEALRCRTFLLDLDPEDGIGAGAWPEPADGELVGADRLA
ncbi:MAG: DUF3151 domain-containing protein [Candidatus Dormibacteria bacterium]